MGFITFNCTEFFQRKLWILLIESCNLWSNSMFLLELTILSESETLKGGSVKNNVHFSLLMSMCIGELHVQSRISLNSHSLAVIARISNSLI